MFDQVSDYCGLAKLAPGMSYHTYYVVGHVLSTVHISLNEIDENPGDYGVYTTQICNIYILTCGKYYREK